MAKKLEINKYNNASIMESKLAIDEINKYFKNDFVKSLILKLYDNKTVYGTWESNLIRTVISFLIRSQKTGENAEKTKQYKLSQNEKLKKFVKCNSAYNFKAIKNILLDFGFKNNKNYDFKNDKLGLILEDLHDENVLFINNIPFFIDTVFFYKNVSIQKNIKHKIIKR